MSQSIAQSKTIDLLLFASIFPISFVAGHSGGSFYITRRPYSRTVVSYYRGGIKSTPRSLHTMFSKGEELMEKVGGKKKNERKKKRKKIPSPSASDPRSHPTPFG